MEVFTRIAQSMNRPPREPNLNQLSEANSRIEKTTARISDAWGLVATTFSVRYNNQDVLIASAHATNNNRGDSRGFYSGGKHYFVITRGTHIALAEQLAYNPQGVTCMIKDEFLAYQSFRDISLLKLLTPEEAIPVIHSIYANGEGGRLSPRERMADIFRSTPELLNSLDLRHGLPQELVISRLKGFRLESIPLTRPRHPAREPNVTPNGYSLGYFKNRPQFAFGDYTRKTNTDGSYNYEMAFDKPIGPERGFSGGPAYDVDERGHIIMRGITTGIWRDQNIAAITPMEYIYDGLDIVTQRATSQRNRTQLANLTNCPMHNNGPDVWLSPSATPPRAPDVRRTHAGR